MSTNKYGRLRHFLDVSNNFENFLKNREDELIPHPNPPKISILSGRSTFHHVSIFHQQIRFGFSLGGYIHPLTMHSTGLTEAITGSTVRSHYCDGSLVWGDTLYLNALN